MPYPEAFLINQCRIVQHRGDRSDQYGDPAPYTATLPPRPCRFTQTTSDPQQVVPAVFAKLVLMPTADARVDDTVLVLDPMTTGGTPGTRFTRSPAPPSAMISGWHPYWVNSVVQVQEPTGGTSHTVLMLRETEHLEVRP